MSARQIPLDLPARTALGRADLFVGASNARALAALDAWRGWPGGRQVLIGPEGAGKTHLAHVWAQAAGAAVLNAADLARADLPALPARLAVEDADRIAGTAAAERALFHLHNLSAQRGGALLVTARAAPARWGLALPDLLSRMQAAPLVAIEPPDDVLLSALLMKHLADRGLAASPAAVAYLAPRVERSAAAAGRLAAALDAAALAEGRAVSRDLAARVLAEMRVCDLDSGPGAAP